MPKSSHHHQVNIIKLKQYFHNCFEIIETGLVHAVSVGVPIEIVNQVFEITPPKLADPFMISLASGLVFSAVEMLGLRQSHESNHQKLTRLQQFFKGVEQARYSLVMFTIAFSIANRIAAELEVEFDGSVKGQLKYFLSVFAPAFLMGVLFFKPIQNFLGSYINKARANIRNVLWAVAKKAGILVASSLIAYETLVLPILVANWLANGDEEKEGKFTENYWQLRFLLGGGAGLIRLVISFAMSDHQNKLWQYWEHLFVAILIYSCEEFNLGFNSEAMGPLAKLLVLFSYLPLVALMGGVANSVSHHNHHSSDEEQQQRPLLEVSSRNYEDYDEEPPISSQETSQPGEIPSPDPEVEVIAGLT